MLGLRCSSWKGRIKVGIHELTLKQHNRSVDLRAGQMNKGIGAANRYGSFMCPFFGQFTLARGSHRM